MKRNLANGKSIDYIIRCNVSVDVYFGFTLKQTTSKGKCDEVFALADLILYWSKAALFECIDMSWRVGCGQSGYDRHLSLTSLWNLRAQKTSRRLSTEQTPPWRIASSYTFLWRIDFEKKATVTAYLLSGRFAQQTSTIELEKRKNHQP